MNDLEKKLSKIEVRPWEEVIKLQNVLVFASSGKLFVVDVDNTIHEFAERDHVINTLCSHAGKLYDGGQGGKVYETLSGNVVAIRASWIRALCSHVDKLYDGSDDKICDTLSDNIVAQRSDSIHSLCSHNGHLYIGELNHYIYRNLGNKVVAQRDSWVDGLCSHDGKLYDCAGAGIYETLGGQCIATRADRVFSLCSHNGKLYDGGFYKGIHESLKDKPCFGYEGIVHAICSHPRYDFVERGILK